MKHSDEKKKNNRKKVNEVEGKKYYNIDNTRLLFFCEDNFANI